MALVSASNVEKIMLRVVRIVFQIHSHVSLWKTVSVVNVIQVFIYQMGNVSQIF